MTKEEAVDLLDNLIGMVTDNHDSDYDEALKMAIDALQRTSNAFPTHECVNPTHEPSRAHELKERRHKSCPMQEVNSRPMRRQYDE